MSDEHAKALAALLQRLAEEQRLPIEHVRLEQGLAAHPGLDAVAGETLQNLRHDLICEQVNEQLRSISLQQSEWLEKASVAQKRYFALPGINQLRMRFGDAPLAWWKPAPLAATDSEHALPVSEQLAHGEPITLRINERWMSGAYLGYDWLGRLVLRIRRGNQSWEETGYWEDSRVLRPVAWQTQLPPRDEQRAPLLGVDAASTLAVSPRAAELLERVVQRVALGELRVIDYMHAARREGYELFIRGGGVRDCLRIAEQHPTGDPTALLQQIKDIDFVTSAPFPELQRIAGAIGARYVNAGVREHINFAHIGVMQVAPQGGEPGRGFDVSCLRLAGVGRVTRYNRVTGDWVTPAIFAKNMETDAWATDVSINTLYARRSDDGVWTLLDPLGCAADDLQNQRLRIPRLAPNFAINALRYWKFRMRGYTSDQRNKDQARALAIETWPTLSRVSLAQMTLPTAMVYVSADYRFEAFFVALRKVMVEDGCEDLLQAYLDTPSMRRELRRLCFETMYPRTWSLPAARNVAS